ncbi:MAG TPA: hypothetical protein VMF60_04975 [Acidimicrobiales bacterium]|nr:hypothetical protein [Acidimicrobiales bacterium]
MSTVEDIRPVPVMLGGVRGGPDVRTLRPDRWWVTPAVTVGLLTAFVVYSTWAVFQNGDFYVGAAAHRDLISPFYSPCLTYSCGVAGGPGKGFLYLTWWTISPGILVLGGPLGFRLTCYYYRRAYYRSFWQSPPACGVADGHGSYSGETRFPLILQNIHRYFFFIALVFNVILTIDAVMAFRMPGEGGIGVSLGTVVLVVNAAFLWLYSLSCHACRHLCGGNVNQFSRHRMRHRLWRLLTPLNARHMQIAWASLVLVALADLYVRLVASGAFSDPKVF